jgi:hypothetical protein
VASGRAWLSRGPRGQEKSAASAALEVPGTWPASGIQILYGVCLLGPRPERAPCGARRECTHCNAARRSGASGISRQREVHALCACGHKRAHAMDKLSRFPSTPTFTEDP